MQRNDGLQNNTIWIGSTPMTFAMGNVAPNKSKLHCRVCHSTLIMHLWHVRIMYVHFTSIGSLNACIHLGMHDHHPTSNGTCEPHGGTYEHKD